MKSTSHHTSVNGVLLIQRHLKPKMRELLRRWDYARNCTHAAAFGRRLAIGHSLDPDAHYDAIILLQN